MTVYQQVLLCAIDAFLLIALLGLLWRRRYRACYSLVPYLVVILASDQLILLWPDRFFFRWFWGLKEALINGLRFAVAIELAFRTFRAFPGARAAARALLFPLLVITLVTVLALTGDPRELLTPQEPEVLIGKLQPRILNGTIWLLTTIAALILWYRLPVDGLHKALLLGLAPFLLLFTTGLNLLDAYGWTQWLGSVSYAHSLGFLALIVYWTYAAWQPAMAPVQAPEPVRALERRVT